MGIEVVLLVPCLPNQPSSQREESRIISEYPQDPQHTPGTGTVGGQTWNATKQIQLGSRIGNGLQQVQKERKNCRSLKCNKYVIQSL